jgi:hypothetical protein
MLPFHCNKRPPVEASAYLILNEELNTLDGSCSCFRDGGGNTTHYETMSVNDIQVCVADVWAMVEALNALSRLLAPRYLS